MDRPPDRTLFNDAAWTSALERFGAVTQLTVVLYGHDAAVASTPVPPTPLFAVFDDCGYQPGILQECAERCVAQKDSRPVVIVAPSGGIAVVGTSLALDGEIVGAAVAGYALIDFCPPSTIEVLAREAGVPFKVLWEIARTSQPVPQRRLVLHGELLQVLGDTVLRENYRTRQYEAATVELQASESRFREIADNAPVMIWVADASGWCTYRSKPWLEFTGQSTRAALGRGWLDVVHPDDREAQEEILVDAASRQAYRLWNANDGEYRWVLASAIRQSGADGDRLGYIGSVVDISDQKHAEDSLRESAEALLEADRIKDQFLATLSHELRTPLTSIMGWVQLMISSQRAEGELSAALQAILGSARTQATLIEDVLDVSRITTGMMKLDRKPSDLARVTEAAVATVRPAAEARHTELRLMLDREIGTVLVDPDRMQQVIWNLLSNAIKFSATGSTVDVTLRRNDSIATLEVRDNGPGIDPRLLPRIFERFSQADSSTKRAFSGLGLGLTLVKDLTELHGGEVTAESQPGAGACFTVSIPIVEHRAEHQHPEQERISIESDPLHGLKVLFVDDLDDARRVFGAILRKGGADVTQAASTDEALASIEASTPDVVVTDIAMPGSDGYDLLSAIRTRAAYANLPVVALTAQIRTQDEAAGGRFTAFLRKPVDVDVLIAVVARAAGRTPAA